MEHESQVFVKLTERATRARRIGALDRARSAQQSAASMEKSRSAHFGDPNGLWGLPFFDVHQHVFPDVMHILDSGIFKTLIEFTPGLAGARAPWIYGERGQGLMDALDKYYGSLQPFKGPYRALFVHDSCAKVLFVIRIVCLFTIRARFVLIVLTNRMLIPIACESYVNRVRLVCGSYTICNCR